MLLEQSIAALALKEGDIAIDCTVGGGGHTELMLQAVGKTGRVIGLDRDETALELARARLGDATRSGALRLVKARFSELGQVVESLKLQGKVQGILADVGVSSMHLDQSGRGFSFQNDGPLDMRMDQSSGQTAADILRDSSAEELTRIFREFGEEPKARQIARRIVESRTLEPLTTTTQLAELVKKAANYREPSRKHPATRVFQALRLAVNEELSELEQVIESSLAALKPGGRVAIIAFHSLEDRIVKTRFLDATGQRERSKLPRELPFTEVQVESMRDKRGAIIKPFPLVPTDDEIQANPRARSAKLRVLEKH